MVPISGWRPSKPASVGDIAEGGPDSPPKPTRNLIKVYSAPRANKVDVHHSSERKSVNPTAKVGSLKQYSDYISALDGSKEVRYENPKRKMSLDNEADDQHHNFTWREVAAILDKVCMRILGGSVVALTIVVLLTMVVGGYAAIF